MALARLPARGWCQVNRELREDQQAALQNVRASIGGVRRFQPIDGFDRYLVSDHGDVFSLIRTTRLLAQCFDPAGYPYVSLMMDDGSKAIKFKVHILVAKAFIPNPLNLSTVNHKNGIKKDFHYENLEWATQKQNNDHARRTGLNKEIGATHHAAILDETRVQLIREMVRCGATHCEVAYQFGLKRKHVTKIVNRHIWAHVP